MSRIELLENIFERYVGARPFKDLEAMVAVSRLIIWAIVGKFSFIIRASAGASQLLFVIILAARFCNSAV